ncbi:alcohol dehydrogenase catalytic domain-containing protein [Rosenbergiella epipactidis]|uniref:alcohol dehydrogenase catalytic domain-containing protein n=1 Tax=Rosenbergiella epipactidis TaxID=1544694 RepID=UPI001F4F0999|nr:alcohol dehydrogenase catalytic domain-containing protein [Rosenbergiella epipactidis]
MFATTMHGAGDVRYEEVADPKILAPTDAIIQLAVSSICGSDLWPYRGYGEFDGPKAMGHEYCGVVVEIGSDVKTVKKGQFVVGSFCLSDNTCPHCQYGFQFLPELLELALARKIQSGKVFDLVLPLAEVAEGYAAMDQRKAIKTLLTLHD